MSGSAQVEKQNLMSLVKLCVRCLLDSALQSDKREVDVNCIHLKNFLSLIEIVLKHQIKCESKVSIDDNHTDHYVFSSFPKYTIWVHMSNSDEFYYSQSSGGGRRSTGMSALLSMSSDPDRALWSLIERIPGAKQTTETVRHMPSVQSPIARSRAWIRMALMQKHLADYVAELQNCGDLLEQVKIRKMQMNIIVIN